MGHTMIARCMAFQIIPIWASLVIVLFGASINFGYFLLVLIFFIRFYFNNTSENKIYYWFIIQSMLVAVVNEYLASAAVPPLYELRRSQILFIDYSVFSYFPFLFFLISLSNKIIAVNNLIRCNKIIEILKIRGEKINTLTQDIYRFGLSTSLNIKTPLFLIESLLANIHKNLLNNKVESQIKYISLIKDSRDLIDCYCAGLYYYKKIHKSSRNSFTDLNLKETINKCISSFEINNSNIVIKNTVHDLNISTNLELFTIIINILIDNGLNYNLRTPCLFITSFVENTNLIIKVIDNGIGIDQSFMKTVFFPFIRIHKISIPGSGLGLYCALIASRKINADLYLEDSGSDGSTFVLKLNDCIGHL